MFEAIVVPDNPLLPMAYPPRVLLEAQESAQVDVWFKEAQEQGQYAGCHLLLVRQVEAKQ